MKPGERRIGIAGVAAFLLSFPLAAASGLIIAPLLAILGMVVFPFDRKTWALTGSIWPVVLGGMFLAWVGLSFLWSPYDNPEQIPKTLLGVPLYIVFALRVGGLEGVWRARVEAAIIFMVVALGLTLIAEMITGGSATMSFKTAMEDNSAIDLVTLERNVDRSLGHATAPLVLLAGPAGLLAWREGGPVIAGLLMTMCLVLAFSFNTEVNAAAFLLATIAAGLAAFWPRNAMSILIGGVAGLLMITPFVVAGIIQALPEGLVENLPLSWQWRLEIWAYTSDLIQQNFLFGHGLDASRPINQTAPLEGYQIDLLPLHPHNAALHIWLEQGLVGAALLAGALVALGGRIAGAPRLSRIQAVAIAWVFTSYVSLVFFSYGVWQEWHQGAVALAVTATLFLGAQRKAG